MIPWGGWRTSCYARLHVCCLGIPAVLSVATAIGLRFLINDAVLLPLLVLSLAITLWGLASGWRRHHVAAPLIVGVAGAIGLFVFSFAHQSRAFAIVSIVALVAASALNVLILRREHARRGI